MCPRFSHKRLSSLGSGDLRHYWGTPNKRKPPRKCKPPKRFRPLVPCPFRFASSGLVGWRFDLHGLARHRPPDTLRVNLLANLSMLSTPTGELRAGFVLLLALACATFAW